MYIHKNVDDLKSEDAVLLWKAIREFIEDHGIEGDVMHKEATQLRSHVFRKIKYPVKQDLWFPGASQPWEQQHVVAVVSERFVLQQLNEAIQIREAWLRQEDLPSNCQMRDGFERKEFLIWAKELYHAEPYQQSLQDKDFHEGGEEKVRSGKKARWKSELQRRLGDPALWYMVTFTGKFDVAFLKTGDEIETPKQNPHKASTREIGSPMCGQGCAALCWPKRQKRKY